MTETKKNILAMIFSIAVGLLLTETALQLFFPIEDPYQKHKDGKRLSLRYIESQFLPHQDWTFYCEPQLSGMADSARFTTNNLGFRGPELIRPKPADELRIFMVGGSTTECLFLDDTLAVTHLLQDKLREFYADSLNVKVYNAGKSGDKSYDHIAMLSHRILHLQPDLVIIFAGINDLTAAQYDKDYIHMPVYDVYPDLNIINLARYFLTEFQLPRRLYYIFQPIFAAPTPEQIQMAIEFKSNYKGLVALKESYPISDTPPKLDLPPYRRNLESIVGLCESHSVQLVFMTQAVTWDSRIDPDVTDWQWITYKNGHHYKEEDMARAMAEYNLVMKSVAEKYDLPLFDLPEYMPKSLEFFYDDCHFNIAGSKRAAKLLSEFLHDNNLLREDSEDEKAIR